MTTVAIVQSCYIPWKGYFDLIRRSDHFVLYDCVQYTTRDWRNRNRIKTAQGLHWLSIPVRHDSQQQLISDTMVTDQEWQRVHWESLRHHYAKAPHFDEYADKIAALYQSCNAESLSDVNLHFLQGLKEMLHIDTPLHLLRKHINDHGDATANLIATCRHHGATRYLSGPSARDYLDVARFAQAGIEVEWMDYSHYSEYPQAHPPFEHGVSILDMLFTTGEKWEKYIA